MDTKTLRRTTATMAAAALAASAFSTSSILAFADEEVTYEKGSVKITKVTGNTNGSYKAFQIFKANVAADGKASEIVWANDDVKDIVAEYCGDVFDAEHAEEEEVPETPDYTNAERAASFIIAHMDEGTYQLKLKWDDFGKGLANAIVMEDPAPASTAMTSGTAKTFDEGWVLIISDTEGDDNDVKNKVSTPPVFARVNKDVAVDITEKDYIPKIEKFVNNQKDPVTKAIGEEVTFKLASIITPDYNSYETYHYEFVDVLDKGLTLSQADDTLAKTDFTVTISWDTVEKVIEEEQEVEKTVHHEETLEDYEVSATTGSDGKTTVKIWWNDTKDEEKYPNDYKFFAPGRDITVTYKASLNDDAVVGETGNNNNAKLIYSNDPVFGGVGETTPDSRKVKTYALKLTKKDKATLDVLEGAKFTIKNSDNKYVASDGTLSSTKIELETDEDGIIEIERGIAFDTYTITETAAPEGGYKLLSGDITLKFGEEDEEVEDSDETVKVIKATMTGAPDGSSCSYKSASSEIEMVILNEKSFKLPITGLDGNMTLTIVGLILVAGCAVGFVYFRRKESRSQD